MNWLTSSVLPKIKAWVSTREIPDKLWSKCPSCGQILFHRDLEENFQVCTSCDHHLRISAVDRLAILFDQGIYKIIDLPKTKADPLKFRDRKKYNERLREAQAKAGRNDAIIVAKGTIGNSRVVCAVFDFSFMGGSMNTSVGDALVRAAKLAEIEDASLIVFPASGGARMQEGIFSLMQMPRTVAAINSLKEHNLPFIVVLTNPTTGGVTASFAMLGDLHIAEPGSIIGFAGQRVIQETIHEQLPEGFQKAEYLREHGMIDLVVHRRELKATLGQLLRLMIFRESADKLVALPYPQASLSDQDNNAGVKHKNIADNDKV
ncbi:acetyl-CoA carboxylase, carboxyl transferase, beta subunit [Candidatus Endolissoclinum faulkneri L5]|uniref:Acetyl-coenzyme A carboxylase carboxyl transferase subunit beta n=1 Tax=Candidatus Endolissoclinum faulkneri L5 TaxID=1401328 RepID=V9TW43_9PROT|nr:acetyl-CoA carboxylase, carboxyltransferase subunit beta [Candidatus Endolissoclinum faulkneri]AHC73545.1 acetyl-CoA carboxylase, carboxyl transferase, beta subunit [Candidatus Endolissoclinum faulkneri L5]